MNLRGVAVASDTVVTSSSTSSSGKSSAKTMGNMGKIYELGQLHNVVILHSGNTDLNSVPAYLYVGEWARTLAAPLPTLRDYVDSFIKWTGRDSTMHTAESEMIVISDVISEHFGWMSNRVKKIANVAAPRAEHEKLASYKKRITGLVDAEIEEGFNYLNSLEKIPDFSDVNARQVLERHEYDLGDWIDTYFEGVEISERSRSLLMSSALRTLTRFQSLNSDLLLAFVGFGVDEPFAGSIRVNCRGIYGGLLQASVDERFSVSPVDNSSGISHYAQGDAIFTFLRGYHADLKDRIVSLISEKTRDIEVLEGESSIADAISEEISSFSHERFVSPLLRTIDAMSLQGLEEFAESLVGLQATATYGQEGPATVGGVIEVVTIDRVNGVKWKKHLAR